MSLVQLMAPAGARRQVAAQTAQGVARDAKAARVIVDAALKGNPAARAFAEEAQELLGAAAVRAARAKRLRNAASSAAVLGAHEIARCGSEAALMEERGAEALRGAVCQAVRESHAPAGFGYLAPEEQRQLRQKRHLEHMTQAQLEQGFNNLLRRLDASALNFGDDRDEADEVDDDAARQIGIAAQLFGGDLPSVFGAGCFSGFMDLFKPNAARLKKRLARKQKRLKKVEAKLEALEEAGKKGLRVKYLRLRMNKLEKSIARIKGKLADLGEAAEKVVKAKKDAKKVEAAETQAVKEAIRDEDDDIKDEKADDELAAAVEVFGARPRRVRRVARRIRRLHRRAARYPRHRARLLRRAHRLRRRAFGPAPRRWWRFRRFRPVVVAPAAPLYVEPSPAYVPTAAPEAYDEAPPPEAEEEDEGYNDEEEEFAADTGLPAAHAALVGYFAKRAALYGADVTDEASFGAGFFEAISDFFKRLVGQGKSAVERQRSAAQAAREARKPHTPDVQSKRQQLRAARQTRRDAGRRAYRRAGGPLPVAMPTDRTVQGRGGYVYRRHADGSITIVRDPSGRATGKRLHRGPAFEAISEELDSMGAGPGLIESIVTTPREQRTAALARQLDRALSEFGPWATQREAEEDLAEEEAEDDALGWF